MDGGVDQRWLYGGHGEYGLNADLGALGVHEGLSLRMQADHRFGAFLAGRDAGVLLPPAFDAATFVPDSENLYLTNVVFTQVVNENVAVMFGKMDTLNGDFNPFASGRGRTGFMNTSLLLPVNGVPIVPLDTLGAGLIYSVEGNPVASLLVLNSKDTTTTSGLSELFEDGAAILGSLNLPLSLNDMPGLQTFSYAYNTQEFTSLEQDPRVILPRCPDQSNVRVAGSHGGAEYSSSNNSIPPTIR